LVGDGSAQDAAVAQTASGIDIAEAASPNARSQSLVGQNSELKLVTVSRASLPDGEISQVTGPDGTPIEKKRDPYIGCTIDGRYKVEKNIGEGGMGVVYRCSHTIIGKQVAMKVLRADMARDQEVTERFLNEAKSASAIGNPHIIDISDFGQLPDGSTYFVMEYLDGIPLTDIVEDGKAVPVPRLIGVARQLAEGLAAAHDAGIVHRDLKPDNIHLVSRGNKKDFVKILDFGIAKVTTSAEGRLTRAGAVFGTPHYMSPEQAAGAPVDHRGDIYSFGVILYELASGKVPFDADNFMGILTQHMYKAPVPIRALVPAPQDVPPGLEAIVLKCLSKRPEQRYQTMQELITDLDKLDSGAIPDAVPEMMNRSGGFNVPADYFKKGAGGMPAPVPARPPEPLRKRSRWPMLVGVAGVITTIVLVVAIFAGSRDSTAQTPTAKAPTAPPTATEKTPAKAAATEPPAASPTMTPVVLAIEPTDAHVFHGDEDLGESPVLLQLAEGETRELEIRRDGYRTEPLTVDASEAKRSVKLERIARGGGRPAPKKPASKPAPENPKSTPKPKSTYSDPGIVNPWGE
jgi:serine/threonine-protein kinase